MLNHGAIQNRTIYCHDNLDVLKGMNSESIDLIYLDPPFNKNKVFTAPIGSAAEGADWKDIFREEDVKDEWVKDIEEDYDALSKFLTTIEDLSKLAKGNTAKHHLYNYCYLAYMARRLIEMQRILKPTGSLYLHCDPTMSHYLKILMDLIFGETNFRNEIVWHYKNASRGKARLAKAHDVIFWYAKNTARCVFNREDMLIPFESQMTKWRYAKGGQKGKEAPKGKVPDDVIEMPSLNTMSLERVGYPTQKPLALLDRMVKASSPKGGVVLDPFCGCATTCVAAETLGRKWIGIDVSHKAYELVKIRLAKEIKGELKNKNGESQQHHEAMFNWEKEVHFTTTPPKRTDQGIDYREKKYVYIMQDPRSPGWYKVGIAKDWRQRLSSYQTGNRKRNCTMPYTLFTANFREVERRVHERFDADGEWVEAKLEELIKAIEGFDSSGANS